MREDEKQRKDKAHFDCSTGKNNSRQSPVCSLGSIGPCLRVDNVLLKYGNDLTQLMRGKSIRNDVIRKTWNCTNIRAKGNCTYIPCRAPTPPPVAIPLPDPFCLAWTRRRSRATLSSVWQFHRAKAAATGQWMSVVAMPPMTDPHARWR